MQINKLGDVHSFVKKIYQLFSHSLGIWTSTVFTGNEDAAEWFSLHGHVRVSIAVVAVAISTVPVRWHGRETHPG